MYLKPANLPGDMIYSICDRFLRGKDPKGEPYSAPTIAKWVREQGYNVSRESIYPILRLGIERGFVMLCPPLNLILRAELLKRYPDAGTVRVLEVKAPTNVVDSLADSAADLLLELILRLGAERNPRGTPTAELRRVQLGFGGGGTSLKVAQRLAQRLRAEPVLPPITIHALSSGFDVEQPLDAPSAFLSLFDDLRGVKIVGLFCAPFVVATRIEEERGMPGIDKALELARDVDIVVTSLAQADDDHGLLNLFFRKYGTPADHAYLAQQGHCGDVLWQPYSDTAPLSGTSIRAFTLFDIPQLVQLSSTPGKHVVAVAGPCVKCAETKQSALLPLLTQPRLRVFNHLVSDSTTIERLLEAGAG